MWRGNAGIKAGRERKSCFLLKLVSSILNIDFPYVHRIFIGEEFPECPTLDIQFKPNLDELLVETGDIEDDITPEKVLNDELFDKIQYYF